MYQIIEPTQQTNVVCHMRNLLGFTKDLLRNCGDIATINGTASVVTFSIMSITYYIIIQWFVHGTEDTTLGI